MSMPAEQDVSENPISVFARTEGKNTLTVPQFGTVRLRVACKSKTPILMDPMPEDTIINDLIMAQRKPADRESSVQDRAAAKVMRDPDGNIAIPQNMLFACLTEGGREMKVPGNTRKNISSGERSLVPSFLRIEEEYLRLYNHQGGEAVWVPDVRKGTGTTGTAVGIVRAKVKEWAFVCTVVVTLRGGITERVVPELFTTAGLVAGLGGFRPQKKGPFGQFEIMFVEELERSGPQGGNKAPEKAKRGRKAKSAEAETLAKGGDELDEGDDEETSTRGSLTDDEGEGDEDRLAAAGADLE